MLISDLRPLGNSLYLNEFVTPETYLVQRLFSSLQRDTAKDTVYSCFDWVCSNIRYKRESGDVFYLPSETAYMHQGDCEDHAFLLCSLLRNFLSPDEVFVAFGTYGLLAEGHAWVTWLNSKYWVLEATLEQAPDSIPEQGYPYDPRILFNDVNTMELKPGFQITRKNVVEKIRQIEKFYGIKVRR